MLQGWHVVFEIVTLLAFIIWFDWRYFDQCCGYQKWCLTGEEQCLGFWLQRLTNQKSDHDTSVCMESMDGRSPMRLWNRAVACRHCLRIWQSRELSVSSLQGAGLGVGLNAEWVSDTPRHFKHWWLNSCSCVSITSHWWLHVVYWFSTLLHLHTKQSHRTHFKFIPIFLYACAHHLPVNPPASVYTQSSCLTDIMACCPALRWTSLLYAIHFV